MPPDEVRERVEKQFLGTVWEDLDIWRYQEYIENPRAGQDRRETVYGAAEVGTAVLRGPRIPYENSDLAELVAPAHTAIVTQECQGAVVGPNAGLAVLAHEARREALPNIARLLPAARGAGVQVVHCLVQRRPDGLGAQPQREDLRDRRRLGRRDRHHARQPGCRAAARTRARHQPISCCADGTASVRWAAPTSTRSCATWA